MKVIGILSILLIAIAIGVQNHRYSLAIPVSAADSNCGYQNDSNRTDIRTQKLNSYNVCVTADYMSRVVAKRPYPQTKITDSIERRNLTEKLLRFNDPNKIAYVTLLSDYGTVIATYTIQGKVSSNQSALTAPLQCNNGNDRVGAECIVSPSDDGSYGENEQGIFFFTTGGILVQWNGKYLLTDGPQQITSAPVVTYNISDKPSSSIDIK